MPRRWWLAAKDDLRHDRRVILGDRIRLRRVERDDLPRCAAWVNDPEVRRHLAFLYPMSVALEEKWFEQQLLAEPAAQPFAIDARAEAMVSDSVDPAWTPVGVCGFHALDWPNRQAPSWACSSATASSAGRATAPTWCERSCAGPSAP